MVIEGKVQGVWFRDSTRRQAEALGVAGWGRNRPDGGVEVVAEGPSASVRRLVEWCRKGPPMARVARVLVDEEPFHGDMRSFEVRL